MWATKPKKSRETNQRTCKHNNLVDALKSHFFFKKLFGSAVFEYKLILGKVQSKFSYFGLLFFLVWNTFYFYCAYNAYSKDQSILRLLYDTKLKRYGDDYEKFAAVLIVLFYMCKIPFHVNAKYVQIIVDIDQTIETLGVSIDYNKNGSLAVAVGMSQIAAFFGRGMCILLTIGHLDTVIPYERMFQAMYSDVVALMIAASYCFCVISLRMRYALINKTLREIQMQKHWEYSSAFASGDSVKSNVVPDLPICTKIKICAKVHCMLYKATKITSELFGITILVIIFFAFNIIVLYMFYFMEATASGLFYDLQRYMYFLIYVMWQAAYAMAIVYSIVYFSQSTVKGAAHSAYIVQEIINNDLGPSITNKAMQLSMQLHNQEPTFEAYGLTMDYSFLIQGALSVVTFLVMLLQFVMDA